nr:immunoglobulin light chain [Hydrolagus colliei]
MAPWVPFLATLMTCLHCVNSLPALHQPPSVSTSLGEKLTLGCTMTGGSISSEYVYWYQQRPGNAPQYLLYTDGVNSFTRMSGVSDRFSGSRDSRSGDLIISSVQGDDAADYYCGVWESGYVFGKGTRVGIGDPRAPSVTVLPPSPDQITAKSKATLVCLVNDFTPGVVEVKWTVDGSARSEGVETSAIKQEVDNTYSVSSYLTLPASEWETHELYSCLVKHEARADPLKTTIARSTCV